MDGAKDFLESNSIIAKFAFLILVVIVFVILLRIGTAVLAWVFSPSPNPYLIKGMIDGTQKKVISQNPRDDGAVPILRSENERGGLEFTWSIWLFVKNLSGDKLHHVFHKGTGNVSGENGIYSISAPGLYLGPTATDNSLLIVMNTFDDVNENIVVPDFPMNKWMNIIIRVNRQLVLDVYMNGRLARRHQLTSVPMQNYDDVYMGLNGGFEGYSSCLRYFNSAIGTKRIQDIVTSGPCTNLLSDEIGGMGNTPRYLSLRWFFTGQKDMYNP